VHSNSNSHSVSGGMLTKHADNEDRQPFDLYPTPPGFTRALLDVITLPNHVWEPAAGEGSMVRVLREYGYKVRATDINSSYPVDFLSSNMRADAIVTNPPYKLVSEFIAQGLAQSDGMLCLLLAQHHLAGKARYNLFYGPTPPTDLIFILDKMMVYGNLSVFHHVWFVWDKSDQSGVTKFHWAFAPKEV